MPDPRDTAEQELQAAAEAALQAWLAGALVDAVTPAAIRPVEVLAHASEWARAVDDRLIPLIRQTWVTRYEQIAGFKPASSLVDGYMRQARNRMVNVPDQVAARIHQVVARNAGTSIPEIAARINDELTYGGTANWPNRAEVIARTETGAAWNGAQLAVYRADPANVGVDLVKRWIATDDERTRPTHAAADGQTVPLDGMFTVGGFPADYPSDPTLPPHEVIQCRCAMTVSTRQELFSSSTVFGRNIFGEGDTDA